MVRGRVVYRYEDPKKGVVCVCGRGVTEEPTGFVRTAKTEKTERKGTGAAVNLVRSGAPRYNPVGN